VAEPIIVVFGASTNENSNATGLALGCGLVSIVAVGTLNYIARSSEPSLFKKPLKSFKKSIRPAATVRDEKRQLEEFLQSKQELQEVLTTVSGNEAKSVVG
jgi:hypothetical protein